VGSDGGFEMVFKEKNRIFLVDLKWRNFARKWRRLVIGNRNRKLSIKALHSPSLFDPFP
jgi:hypothetical protein